MDRASLLALVKMAWMLYQPGPGAFEHRETNRNSAVDCLAGRSRGANARSKCLFA